MPAFIPLPSPPIRPRTSTRPPSRLQMSFRDNLATLPAASGDVLHLHAFRNRSVRAPNHDLVLRNQPGKTASFRIFHACAAARAGLIDPEAAADMLATYAEIVDDARRNPGAHPTVDFLIDVVEDAHDLRFVCKIDGVYF